MIRFSGKQAMAMKQVGNDTESKLGLPCHCSPRHKTRLAIPLTDTSSKNVQNLFNFNAGYNIGDLGHGRKADSQYLLYAMNAVSQGVFVDVQQFRRFVNGEVAGAKAAQSVQQNPSVGLVVIPQPSQMVIIKPAQTLWIGHLQKDLGNPDIVKQHDWILIPPDVLHLDRPDCLEICLPIFRQTGKNGTDPQMKPHALRLEGRDGIQYLAGKGFRLDEFMIGIQGKGQNDLLIVHGQHPGGEVALI